MAGCTDDGRSGRICFLFFEQRVVHWWKMSYEIPHLHGKKSLSLVQLLLLQWGPGCEYRGLFNLLVARLNQQICWSFTWGCGRVFKTSLQWKVEHSLWSRCAICRKTSLFLSMRVQELNGRHYHGMPHMNCVLQSPFMPTIRIFSWAAFEIPLCIRWG